MGSGMYECLGWSLAQYRFYYYYQPKEIGEEAMRSKERVRVRRKASLALSEVLSSLLCSYDKCSLNAC